MPLLFAWILFLLCCVGCRETPQPENLSAPYVAARGTVDTPALYSRIKAAVDSIRLIDVHEHLSTEQLRLTDKVDFFYLFQHYSSSDLVSAGMPVDDLIFIQNPDKPLDERWKKMAPYWPWVKQTGYGQALRIAARDIYGIPDITELTWRDLSRRMTDANKPGIYNKILKDMARIDLVIVDCVTDDPYLENLEPDLFVRAKDFDPLISMKNSEGVRSMETSYHTAIRSVDNIIAIIDSEFARFPSGNIVCVKCKLAYHRPLLFEEVDRAAALRVLAKLRQSSQELPFEERKPLEDFIMHRIVERCGKYGYPIQIHTGLQEGNGTYAPADPWDENTTITDSQPTLLLNLIRKYPETRFDIFHGSFPYMGEMTTMVKNFQNVNLNLCWLSIISPSTAKDWLHRWIEIVPANKIHFFGGDYRFAEGAYGQSVIARYIVTETIAEKVAEGYLEEDEGIRIARRMLRDNAIEFYNLSLFLDK